jgi:hypothetical protein
MKSSEPLENRFVSAGKRQKTGSLFSQFFLQIKANRKWWLFPLLLIMLALALLIALSGSAAAPFIYTLF